MDKVKVILGLKHLGCSPKAWYLFIKYNFFSNHVLRNNKYKFLLPTRNALIKLEKGAKLILNGNFILGTPQMKGSHIEGRLLIQENGTLVIGAEGFEQFAGMYIRVMPKGELEINGLVANEGCSITAGKKIHIGSGSLFARDVTLRSDDVHYINEDDYEPSKPITIENHVWVGQGATILKGVTIGHDSIVAAKSLVVKDIPCNSLVAGVPAKVIKQNVNWHA